MVCAMLTLAIKNLEVYLSNSNLPFGKNAIWVKFLAQNKETSKQTAGV